MSFFDNLRAASTAGKNLIEDYQQKVDSALRGMRSARPTEDSNPATMNVDPVVAAPTTLKQHLEYRDSFENMLNEMYDEPSSDARKEILQRYMSKIPGTANVYQRFGQILQNGEDLNDPNYDYKNAIDTVRKKVSLRFDPQMV